MIYDLSKPATMSDEVIDPHWRIRASPATVAGVSLHPEQPLLAISTGQRVYPQQSNIFGTGSSSEDEEEKQYTDMLDGFDNSLKLYSL